MCQSLSFLINSETQANAPSCQFCEIFQNTFFMEHLRATASANGQTYFKYLAVFTVFRSSIFKFENKLSFL